MTPEEREELKQELKQELRAEIMAEVHTAIWAALDVHVNGPSPAVAAPIGSTITPHQAYPLPVIVGSSGYPGPHVNIGAAAPVPIPSWRQLP